MSPFILQRIILLSPLFSKFKSGVPLEREINPPPSPNQDKIKVKYTYIHIHTCIHILSVYLHIHIYLFTLCLCNYGELWMRIKSRDVALMEITAREDGLRANSRGHFYFQYWLYLVPSSSLLWGLQRAEQHPWSRCHSQPLSLLQLW